MRANEAKKCKKCGATLVGKKAYKGGLCSNCTREIGQSIIKTLSIIGMVFGAVGGAIAKAKGNKKH